ncbi:hypothetical protein [Methylibium sp. T29]|uniref:hypothetical protein n=1 Tax=Methylibium sp. T29 TaxID=1430884 RepID=UPI0004AED26D|nr:hypothetical protein [Methylibium sp. T29]
MRGLNAALMLGVLGSLAVDASSQEVKHGSAIYTCTNAAGRTLTRDRPIAECMDREQRVLNSDGSLRTVLQPSLTSDERAVHEEAERRKAQERANKQEAIRRDRNLLARFPNEAAHNKARDAALNATRSGIQPRSSAWPTCRRSASRCSTRPSSTRARTCRASSRGRSSRWT